MAGLAVLLGTAVGAVPAHAVTLGYSQTTGFLSSSGATLQTLDGGAPVAGRGGLEFFSKVTGPPGVPLGDGTAPANIWSVVGWGCAGTAPFYHGCAANGITFPATDPFTNANRSALRITGFSGFLTDLAWQDISLIEHKNSVIAGNALKTVTIESILRLGSDPFAIESPDTTLLSFRETLNSGGCGVAPLPGAPANPLGSTCDDFFIVQALDLSSIALGGGLFIDFRLDARDGALVCSGVPANDPAACGGYVGDSIVVYTQENDINSLAVQARLRLVTVPEAATLLLLGIGVAGGAVRRIVRRRRA